MAAATQYRTKGLTQLTFGSTTYNGMAAADLAKPGQPKTTKSDDKVYNEDLVVDVGDVVMTISGTKITASTDVVIGTEFTTFTLKAPSRDSTNDVLTIGLTSNSIATLLEHRIGLVSLGGGAYGNETLVFGFYNASGTDPVSIAFNTT